MLTGVMLFHLKAKTCSKTTIWKLDCGHPGVNLRMRTGDGNRPLARSVGSSLGIGFQRLLIYMQPPEIKRSKVRLTISCQRWRVARKRMVENGLDRSRKNTWIGWRAVLSLIHISEPTRLLSISY